MMKHYLTAAAAICGVMACGALASARGPGGPPHKPAAAMGASQAIQAGSSVMKSTKNYQKQMAGKQAKSASAQVQKSSGQTQQTQSQITDHEQSVQRILQQMRSETQAAGSTIGGMSSPVQKLSD